MDRSDVTSNAANETTLAGAVTFLFTDVVGSSARWERDRATMSSALRCHDGIVRRCIEGAGGDVFKTVGDAFYSTFARAHDAVRAAAELQTRMGAEDWSRFASSFEPLEVRVAIHTGDAELRHGDYFGPTVNRVARLMAEADGGQILISLVTQQLVRDEVPPGARLVDRGERRLKDLLHDEHLFEVVVDAAPRRGAAPARHGEQADVGELLAEGDRATPASSGRVTSAVESARSMVLEAVRAGEPVSLPPRLLTELAHLAPKDLTEYRIGRVAEWSQPRYHIDERFVQLTLLLDALVEDAGGPATSSPGTDGVHADLRSVLRDCPDAALVLLGPPGCGKSTLLRRLELDVAAEALQGRGESDAVTFFVSLNQYRPSQPGASRLPPDEWLAELWRSRYPELPSLRHLMRQGRLILLLDGLNEAATTSAADYHSVVGALRAFIQRDVARSPGSRTVVSCRALDYSAPLSSPNVPVPQVRVEALTDEQVRDFLKHYCPLQWREVWQQVSRSSQLEMLRSPYLLRLLSAQVEAEGHLPSGRAGLFTGFTRRALLREVERGNPLFRPDHILTARDLRRLATHAWRSATDLPARGPLLGGLASLAFHMQRRRFEGDALQVRVDYDDAVDIIDHEHGEDILQAAMALSVVDEDPASDEVMFVHPLVQEYMAARRLALHPDEAAELVRAPWRATEIDPALDSLRRQLAPAEPLPPPPATGWEETVRMAAAMAAAPDQFVEAVRSANLVVAGRCAAQMEANVSEAVTTSLREALLSRSRDVDTDLRARIEAAVALGELGDPRLEPTRGGVAAHVVPELVVLAGGEYSIGSSSGGDTDESPEHIVRLDAFALARHPVTIAEWALFMESGGYDDCEWWDTPAAVAWQCGGSTSQGLRAGVRHWLEVYSRDGAKLESDRLAGGWDDDTWMLWRRRLEMSADELEAHLREMYPSGRVTAPQFWRDSTYDLPNVPVVGICWFEARAYARWLASVAGMPFRLPTEAEAEAASRGPEGRLYAYGNVFDVDRCNTSEAHLRRPSPIGVFPGGDTPEGLVDMTGNVWEWTSSLYGRRLDRPDFAYPYRPDDGREDPNAGADVSRVARGGGWFYDGRLARATLRYISYPDARNRNLGLRLAMDLDG